jgi:KUP system potassium uptake protein
MRKTTAQATASAEAHATTPGGNFWPLTVGAVGVVYGDIGTSPLYAIREAVNAVIGSQGAVTNNVVYGILSLIFWTLIIIVTLKYIAILLRADNDGEGGTLSLTALVFRALGRGTPFALVLGVIGASMFYGSTLITPALSVLSAVEGLKVVTPALDAFVVPLAIVILIALFSVQWRGTAKVSALFGPITVAWFVIMGIAGAIQIAANPNVLLAVNPTYAVAFLLEHRTIGLVALAAVFLVVTGAEALYNDLGHFGRKPIQAAWIFLVLPALVLNYFGQGALLLADPTAIENPFFMLFPEVLRLPMVGMATAATVIASQAVITGAYSITRQAIQLGLLPRLDVRHTSETIEGQIYIPRINLLMLLGVLFLTILFQSSSALAAAYVLAVSVTLLVSSALGFVVIWKYWQWRLRSALLLMAPFIALDALFVVATSLNLLQGAWLPIVIAAALALVMLSWVRGTAALKVAARKNEADLDWLVRKLEAKPPHRVNGTAVFLTSTPDAAPSALLHNLKHNHMLHERNIIMSIKTADTPYVANKDRVEIGNVSNTFTSVTVTYGFMETPSVPKALALCRRRHLNIDASATSFFLSRRVLRPASRSQLPRWQEKLFIWLAGSAEDASAYFQIPADRVVEVGTQIAV